MVVLRVEALKPSPSLFETNKKVLEDVKTKSPWSVGHRPVTSSPVGSGKIKSSSLKVPHLPTTLYRTAPGWFLKLAIHSLLKASLQSLNSGTGIYFSASISREESGMSSGKESVKLSGIVENSKNPPPKLEGIS